jgi:hypothetical protein
VTQLGRRIFAVLFCLLTMAGCAASQPAPTAPLPKGDVEVTVIARDWHTEIGIAVGDISGPLARVDPAPDGEKYLLVGFGDLAFFTDPEAGFGKAFAALFSGPAAIQLATFQELPEDATHKAVRFHLSKAAVDRIVAFIWNSLEQQPDGTLRQVAVHGPGNIFYAARQPYDGFYNCNSWTADALRQGGLPFDPSGILFASEVMQQAERIAAAIVD